MSPKNSGLLSTKQYERALRFLWYAFGPSGLPYLLPDLQRSLAEWLGLLVLAPLPVQHRQVVQGGRHLHGNRETA